MKLDPALPTERDAGFGSPDVFVVAAKHYVVAGAAVENVVAVTARKRVGIIAAVKLVIAGAARADVAAAQSVKVVPMIVSSPFVAMT